MQGPRPQGARSGLGWMLVVAVLVGTAGLAGWLVGSSPGETLGLMSIALGIGSVLVLMPTRPRNREDRGVRRG